METQLLQNYSEAEKTAYLGAIAALATADRQATAPEAEFLQRLAQQAGISDGATRQVLAAADSADNQTVQRDLDALKGSDLRFSLITDLISFARADGAYSNDEEAMIGRMAQYLGVNPEQRQTLESVVDQAATVQHNPQDPGKQSFLGGLGDKLSNVGIPKGALMAGLLGVVAPMVISKVMGGGSSSAGYNSPQQQSGTLGGLLSGAMGSLGGQGTLGGMLGSMLGGGMLGGGNQQMDTSQYPQQGSLGNSGLGSIMSVLGGLGGQSNSQPRSAGGGGIGGSLGSLLGGLFG